MIGPRTSPLSRWILAASMAAACGTPAQAADFAPTETLFPAATRAWLSIPDPRGLRERFDRSQYGQLIADPAMKTFVDAVKDQVTKNGKQRLEKLGLTLDDLAEVVGGEIGVAAIEVESGRLATVLVVDTSGHEAEARALVERIGARLIERKAEKIAIPDAPPQLTVYQLPPEQDERRTTAPRDRRVAFALADSALVVGDDALQVGQALAVLAKGRADSLASLPSFRAVMGRCGPHGPATVAPLRWYIDPLAFARGWQVTNPPLEKRKGPDYVAILGRQGFDAVRAAGGVVVFSDGPHAVRHHTLIHAPPLEGRDPASVERFDLAARMLRFPNVAQIAPPDWVPRDVAGWMALEWDLGTAFTVAETLVDDIVGDKGVYDDVIASLKEDPDGPQIDVAADLIAGLGTRVTVITDHVEPIGTDAERLVIAIETKDEARVAATIAKVMGADAEMRRIEIGGHTAWELVEHVHEVPELQIETPGGALTHADEESEGALRRQRLREKEEKLLPHSTVTVARGHLLIASHRDVLEKVLVGSPVEGGLGGAGDYRGAMAEVGRFVAGPSAARSFGREDESIRPAYEMLRQGLMPKSKSVFGQLLNGLLGDGKPGSVREQRIDGSSLPEFDVVRKYFGTVGTALETLPEGWYLAGVVLPKPPQPEVARQPVAPVGR